MRRILFSLLVALAAYLVSPAIQAAMAQSLAQTKPKASSISFSPKELPADRDGASLLTIPAPGRYSIRAKSPTGARIELVDQIAGPLDSSGAAGVRDGRIDALLDKGVYKIRVAGVKGANGKTTLSAEPFSETDATKPTLVAGKILSGDLGDLQQRSFALEVGADGRVAVEAIGRALADLRVWQTDGELVDLSFDRAAVETRPGRFMTRMRLEGTLAPGRYVVTAYGGEKLVWSDAAAAQPFMIRLDSPVLLTPGVAEGVIDAFGIARFEAPASYDAFRLELPQPAPARLEARRGALRDVATIEKRSRAPVASLRLASDGKASARVEVSGFEGQPFSLRAVRQSNRETFEAAGPHLVSIDVAGEGGDEIPATALLARVEKDGKTRVIASDAPRIGAGKAWRGKFNVFGPTSLLFEATRDGPVAIDAKGVKLRATIEPALGSLAPRADGKDQTRYDLQAGYYFLLLEPQGDAGGAIDVTLGPPGLAAPAPTPPQSRASISFGEQALEKEGSYLILANAAPALLTGPRVVALPAELDKAPLALRQEAGKEIAISTRTPKAGKIVAQDEKGAAVPLAFADEKFDSDARIATAKIAPATRERAIGLTFIPDPPASEAKSDAAPAQGRALTAGVGKPVFFDLARDETKNLRFDATQGGLYRIETLGRLKTALRVGANVSPRLGEGEANGPGKNGLVTAFLRAGAYRAVVSAKESAGRVGLSVSPASLAPTARLTANAEARATIEPGKGAIIPIEIASAGDYRIDLLGLARTWRARLEDADGWPLEAPGEIKRLTRHFEPGAYNLVVAPEDVEARLVARLTPILAKPALEGHGPHALPFGKTQELQWREPQARDAPRTPDVWRFALHGDADIDLSIDAGMIGEIIKGADEAIGKVASDRPFKAKLAAGDYRVEARSLAHDDRLDYGISLNSKQLQPGAPRRVDLPARLEFSLAKSGVVDLRGSGEQETIGVLRDSSGDVVERLQTRPDDWNVALSRRLPAGAYRLELEELGAKPNAPAEDAGERAEEDSTEETDGGADTEGNDSGVEIRLALLDEKDDGALAATGETTVSGNGAHRLSLPPAPAGGLALVAARSQSEVALSIEHRHASGVWRAVGVERGLNPVAVWPAGGEDGNWRALAWSVGGEGAPIALAARGVERRGRAAGEIALDAVEGVEPRFCVAKVETPGAALVEVSAPGEIITGSAPSQLLRATRPGPLAPQSTTLWLGKRGDCRDRVRVAAFEWKGEEISLDIGENERAHLPPRAAPRGKSRLWLARSAFGQPGVEAGQGFGVAPGAALALSGETAPRVWNASGAGATRVALRAIDLETRDPLGGGALFAGVIPPKSAQPVDMEKSDAPLAIDVAGGVAAFVDSRAVFGDDAGIARTLHRPGARVVLANLTDAPLPARVARLSPPGATLDAQTVFKRFFGAAGEISLPIDARIGDRLRIVGGEAAVIARSGRVYRGSDIALDGPGEAVIGFSPGLVAAWIERDGATPWPQAAARAVSLPQRVNLEGAAMRFTLRRDAPGLLDVTSGAPAILAFTQNGKREVAAFAAGVDFHRYLPAGETTLDIYAPHDGLLSGALDLAAQSVIEAHDGVNEAVAVAPGASAIFSFETTRESDLGFGVRAEPDRVSARLFDANGKTIGEGIAQTARLAPGRYFLEARVPPDAPATTIRAAIVGLSPPPAAPPEEAVAELLEKSGMKKSKTR